MPRLRHLAGKYLGEGLIAVGLVHSAAAITTFRDELAGIVNDGLWATVDIAGSDLRGESLWFTVSGAMLIVSGFLVRSHVRTTGTLPMSFSVGLTIVGAAITVAMPDSGAWMALAGGLLAMVVSTNRERVEQAASGKLAHCHAGATVTA